jgi:hypothetical protein
MRRRGKLGVGVALAWLGGMLYYVQISKQKVRFSSTYKNTVALHTVNNAQKIDFYIKKKY